MWTGLYFVKKDSNKALNTEPFPSSASHRSAAASGMCLPVTVCEPSPPPRKALSFMIS